MKDPWWQECSIKEFEDVDIAYNPFLMLTSLIGGGWWGQPLTQFGNKCCARFCLLIIVCLSLGIHFVVTWLHQSIPVTWRTCKKGFPKAHRLGTASSLSQVQPRVLPILRWSSRLLRASSICHIFGCWLILHLPGTTCVSSACGLLAKPIYVKHDHENPVW